MQRDLNRCAIPTRVSRNGFEVAQLLVPDFERSFLVGDGVFEVEELQLRAIPHSGVTGMTAMWMVFSEALSMLRAAGVTPRLYECVNVEGARAKNAVQIEGYLELGVDVLGEGEAAAAVAAATA